MSGFFKKRKIQKSISTGEFGRNVVYMSVCDSTNELAKRKSDMPHGTLFIADEQTNGKGRQGNRWESEKKCGLYMSLLLKPDIPVSRVSQITLIAGLAVCRALGCDTKIKWPNDVVIGTRKVCGILTEKSGDAVICGIGINVNTKTFPSELSDKATSLFIETNKKQDIDYICALVMSEFEPLYEKFIQDGFTAVYEDYSRLCVTIGREIRVIQNGSELIGVATGISTDGGLIVETDDDVVTITAGDVSVRGLYGYV